MSIQDRFIEAVLQVFSRYKEEWNIVDIYAYKAYGRLVKAVGMYILMLCGEPKTINMYLFSNRDLIILTDITPKLSEKPKCDKVVKLSLDLYEPAEDHELCVGGGTGNIGYARYSKFGEERVAAYIMVNGKELNAAKLADAVRLIRDFLIKNYMGDGSSC